MKCLSKKRVNGEKKIKGGRGCTNTSINISWPFLELSKAGQRSEVFLGFFALFVVFFFKLCTLYLMFSLQLALQASFHQFFKIF